MSKGLLGAAIARLAGGSWAILRDGNI